MTTNVARLAVVATVSVACSVALFTGTAFVSPSAAPSKVASLRAGRSYVQSAGTEDSASTSGTSCLAACGATSLLLAAGAVAARRGAITRYVNAPKKVKLEQIPRPEKLLESPRFPLFAGTTDGYFARATRERHAMTWTGPKEVYFEMPTGGFAYMNKGENLCYFRKKEQAIALSKNLRKLKINDIKIYRIKKDGTVIFMHPLDGIWPENVTTGRPLINWRPFPTSGNPQPADLKFTKYHQKCYEADPLSTMFVKARQCAFTDQESIFPLPQPGAWMERDSSEYADYTKKMKELVNSLPPLPKSL